MTNERARSELEQLYMSLSEEKKKALDVAFKAMEQTDNLPVMYYPQVDGITPTVVAQADGEKTCGTCRNEDTYHCAECENKSDYEQSQADGEYILKKDVMGCIGQTSLHWELTRKLRKLPSVAIPNKTGHWIEQIDHEENCRTLICSNCDRPALHDEDSIWKHKFCPHCGAKMD
jgi:hypothetical protein